MHPMDYLMIKDKNTYDHVLSDIERLSNQKRKPADIYLTPKETYDETTRPEIKTIYNKVGYVKAKTAQINGQITTTNIADQTCHLDNLVTDNDNFVRSIIRTRRRIFQRMGR